MIHKEPPEKFSPRFHVVSCYLENNGKILLLLRPKQKSQGGKWGVPAGKIDEGEDEFTAMIRELEEETGVAVPKESLEYIEKLYVRYSDYDFIYTMFKSTLAAESKITLRDYEHEAYKWVTPVEALDFPLVDDLDSCIKLFYKI